MIQGPHHHLVSLVSGHAVPFSWILSKDWNMMPEASLYLESGVLLLEQTVLHYDELSSSFWRHCFCFPSWQPCHKPRSSWGTVLPHCLICCHRHLIEVVIPLTQPAVIQQSVLHIIKKPLGSGRLHFAFFLPYVGCAGRLSLLLQLHSAFFFLFFPENSCWLTKTKQKTAHRMINWLGPASCLWCLLGLMFSSAEGGGCSGEWSSGVI